MLKKIKLEHDLKRFGLKKGSFIYLQLNEETGGNDVNTNPSIMAGTGVPQGYADIQDPNKVNDDLNKKQNDALAQFLKDYTGNDVDDDTQQKVKQELDKMITDKTMQNNPNIVQSIAQAIQQPKKESYTNIDKKSSLVLMMEREYGKGFK